jgi:hypothetical protein
MNFFTGIIVGIVIATVGLTGIARMADRGVNLIKHEARQLDSIPIDKN